MKKFLTEIRAIDVESKQLRTFCGPDVWAKDIKAARVLLAALGLSYCIIVGVAVDSPIKVDAFNLNCLN